MKTYWVVKDGDLYWTSSRVMWARSAFRKKAEHFRTKEAAIKFRNIACAKGCCKVFRVEKKS